MTLARIPAESRERQLIAKRSSGGLSFGESTELLRIQREKQIAADLAADRATESRRMVSDDRNFHE